MSNGKQRGRKEEGKDSNRKKKKKVLKDKRNKVLRVKTNQKENHKEKE